MAGGYGRDGSYQDPRTPCRRRIAPTDITVRLHGRHMVRDEKVDWRTHAMGAWKGRSEAIMVDYHTAVETVRNPHADPVMLARIAYKNPEFGANVAANPRAYPGLIHWLAQFGDARARAYIREGRLDTIADDMGAGNTNVGATVTGRQTPKRRNRWTPHGHRRTGHHPFLRPRNDGQPRPRQRRRIPTGSRSSRLLIRAPAP